MPNGSGQNRQDVPCLVTREEYPNGYESTLLKSELNDLDPDDVDPEDRDDYLLLEQAKKFFIKNSSNKIKSNF